MGSAVTVLSSGVRFALLLAVVGCGLTVAHAQPAVQLEVRFSKPLAVFHYIRQLTPKARTNPYKAQFEASRFATAANLARLDAFGAIRTDYEYSYPDYPDGKIEGSTSYILKRSLLLASSLADFRARSIAVLPSGDLSTIVSSLEAFTPAYDALIYEPNRTTFERQLAEIEALLKDKQAAALFDRMRVFYRASWDPSIPFIFAF